MFLSGYLEQLFSTGRQVWDLAMSLRSLNVYFLRGIPGGGRGKGVSGDRPEATDENEPGPKRFREGELQPWSRMGHGAWGSGT